MNSILIVDDEKNMLVSLEAIFKDAGFETKTAQNGEDALNILSEKPADVVITDLKMSGMTGLELLEKIKNRYSRIPVIMITAYATPNSAVEAIKCGAFDYIQKPFDPEEIVFIARKALDYLQIQRENIDLKEKLQGQKALEEIIGEDPAIASIKQLIQTIAPTKATVLIQGESGTGKELVAKAIHELSHQNKNAFVPVNCAAIPEPLLESELFGHEKGSFTGALMTKKGKFEIANEGTIYLDEVGDMSLALQAKILRVLEDGKFERVGGNSSLYSGARIIAATNKDLKQAIQEGKFREDLYFRLNVISIQLPPLRDRAVDISILINHFIERFNVLYGKNISGFDHETLDLMMKYRWPGNIRELKNIIERVVLLTHKKTLSSDLLPIEILKQNQNIERNEFSEVINFKEAVECYEKQLIQLALEKNQNRITDTAKALGLSRYSLRRYILKYFGRTCEFDT